MPQIIVIAGPNGAGKSTTAPVLLRERYGIVDYVNADTIAAGLAALAPERAAFQAGRIMLQRLDQLRRERRDFAFETTLSTRSYVPWLTRSRAEGFEITLLFLSLRSPDQAIARVAERVRAGGHAVTEETVRRRFARGFGNFQRLYTPLADHWQLIDNSLVGAPCTIASGGRGREPMIQYPALYQMLEQYA